MENTEVGDRIELIEMPEDPNPIPMGTQGTVTKVVKGIIAQIWVQWDNGRTLALLPDTDSWLVISKGEDDDQVPA